MKVRIYAIVYIAFSQSGASRTVKYRNLSALRDDFLRWHTHDADQSRPQLRKSPSRSCSQLRGRRHLTLDSARYRCSSRAASPMTTANGRLPGIEICSMCRWDAGTHPPLRAVPRVDHAGELLQGPRCIKRCGQACRRGADPVLPRRPQLDRETPQPSTDTSPCGFRNTVPSKAG